MVIQVPTRGPANTNLAPAPIESNNVKASGDAFGANIGRAMTGAGQQVSQSANIMADVAFQQQEKVNVTVATDAYERFRKEWRGIEADLKSRQGLEAQHVTKEATEKYKEISEQFVGELNEGARTRYEALIKGARESKLDSFATYEQSQLEEASKQQNIAMAQLAVNDAIESGGNPEQLAKSKAIISHTLKQAMPGASAEQLQVANETALTQMHNSIIDDLMVASPEAASAYYEGHKDEILPKQQTAIEEKLRIKTEITVAQAFADEALKTELTETEAIAQARKNYEGTQEKAVVQEIKLRFTERDTARREEIRLNGENTWKAVANGGSVNDMPPSVLASLDPRTISSLMAFEQQRAETGRGYAAASDPATMNNIHNLWMDDKAAFASEDLNNYRPDLTESDYKYWLSQQRILDKANEKEKQKQTSYALSDRLAKEYLRSAGIKFGQSASDKDNTRAQTVLTLARQIVDDGYDSNKKPTREDIEKELTALFLTGEVEGSGIFENDDYTFYEVAGTPDAQNFYLDDVDTQLPQISKVTGVPQGDIMAVVGVLKKADKPITPDNIRKMYEAGLR